MDDRAPHQRRLRLYFKPNISLVLIEAKDNAHSVGDGMQQGLEYAATLDIAFVFSLNDEGFVFHDRTGSSARSCALGIRRSALFLSTGRTWIATATARAGKDGATTRPQRALRALGHPRPRHPRMGMPEAHPAILSRSTIFKPRIENFALSCLSSRENGKLHGIEYMSGRNPDDQGRRELPESDRLHELPVGCSQADACLKCGGNLAVFAGRHR